MKNILKSIKSCSRYYYYENMYYDVFRTIYDNDSYVFYSIKYDNKIIRHVYLINNNNEGELLEYPKSYF